MCARGYPDKKKEITDIIVLTNTYHLIFFFRAHVLDEESRKMKRRRGDALRGSARKQARRATIGPRFVFVTVAGAFGKLPQEDEVNLKVICVHYVCLP